MKRNVLLMLILLVTTQAFSAVHWDENRREVKKVVMKGHRAITHYKTAREHLLQQVHLQRDSKGYYIKDTYCDRVLRRSVGPNKMPAHTILNVEHTWPQSRFNKSKNRHIQKSDLHHLYPTNSVANGIRGNYHFSDVDSAEPLRGCSISKLGFVRGTSLDAFEPPASHKGNVARALFYFSIRYDIEIKDFEEKVLRRWHKLDPVDAKERARNLKISSIQGNRNPFIDNPSLVRRISDF